MGSVPGQPGQLREQVKRKIVEPVWSGTACLYITRHTSRRLVERFNIQSLRKPPFIIHTQKADTSTWAIRVGYGDNDGFLLGRWEEPYCIDPKYKHWFVATTAITIEQYNNSQFEMIKSVRINVVRILNEQDWG